MSTDEPKLRAALESGPDGKGCPAPELFLRAAAGALASEEVQALLDHAATCGSCALALRLAREVPQGNVSLLRPRRLGFAAAALAAAAAVLLVPVLFRRDRDPLRGDTPRTLRSTVPPGPLPRSRFLLRWTPLASARYDVVVATRDLLILYSAHDLAIAELLVPEPALAPLPPGATILFTVTATLPDGRRISSGALQSQ